MRTIGVGPNSFSKALIWMTLTLILAGCPNSFRDILPGSDPTPVAQSQSVNASYSSPTSITLSGTSSIGLPLSSGHFTLLSSPSHGTLTGVPPSLTYTPTGGFSGTDSFTFLATDGGTNSNVASVSLVVPSPVTYYFNNDSSQPDADWSTLSNWWLDSSYLIHALHLPTNGDRVYLTGTNALTAGPLIGGGHPTPLYLSLFDSSALIPADGTGLDIPLTSNIKITDAGVLTLGVLGDTSSNNLQNWNGSVASSSVTSTFQGTSFNYGSTGTTLFQDFALNFAHVLGDATFNGTWNSYVDQNLGPWGTVDGNAVYNTLPGCTSLGGCGGNDGNVMGSATFNGYATNGYDAFGTVGGVATFHDSSANQIVVGGGGLVANAIFYSSSFNSGILTGSANFRNSSLNYGEVQGNANFYDSSQNNDSFASPGTVDGLATFYDASANGGLTPNHSPVCNTTGSCP